MAKFYKLDLWDVDGAHYPPMVPLLGLKLAKRARARSVMRAQNRIPALGRRVVLTQAINGWRPFAVPNTDPTQGPPTAGPRTHPPPELERPVVFGKFDLTPGCFLRLSVLYTPSGRTQVYQFNSMSNDQFNDGGGVGRLRLSITWTDQDGTSATTSHTVTLDASQDEFGAVPSDGDIWLYPRLRKIDLMIPEDIAPTAELNQWTRHTHVEITGYHIGGTRIVDACVSERPVGLAMEADDAAGLWVAPCWGSTPNASGPPYEFPIERLDSAGADGDPRGHVKVAESHHAQWNRLGPAMFSWTAWDEDNADLGNNTDNTTISRSFNTCSSDTYVRLVDGASIGYDATEPGWSMMTGAYSRRLDYNHPSALNGKNGTVPVWIDVLTAWGSASPPTAGGHVKIQSAAYSFVEVPVPDTHGVTWTWITGFGHLRCGTGPGDPIVAQAFFKRDATGSVDMHVAALQVTRAGAWARP